MPVQQPTESNRPKVPGVSWDRKSSMWRVRIYVDGKEKCLGRFEEYESAIKARRDAELKYKGRPPIQVEGG